MTLAIMPRRPGLCKKYQARTDSSSQASHSAPGTLSPLWGRPDSREHPRQRRLLASPASLWRCGSQIAASRNNVGTDVASAESRDESNYLEIFQKNRQRRISNGASSPSPPVPAVGGGHEVRTD